MVGLRITGLPECGPTESSAPKPCCFYNLFHDYIFIPIKYGPLYSEEMALAEEMAPVCDEIDVKDEPLFPSLECKQVCSVFITTLMFTIDLICIIQL